MLSSLIGNFFLGVSRGRVAGCPGSDRERLIAVFFCRCFSAGVAYPALSDFSQTSLRKLSEMDLRLLRLSGNSQKTLRKLSGKFQASLRQGCGRQRDFPNGRNPASAISQMPAPRRARFPKCESAVHSERDFPNRRARTYAPRLARFPKPKIPGCRFWARGRDATQAYPRQKTSANSQLVSYHIFGVLSRVFL